MRGPGELSESSLLQRAFFLRDTQQRRVKLHECMVDGTVLRVTCVAAFRGRPLFTSRGPLAEAEERPFVGKAALVLNFCFNSGEVALEVTRFVD